MIKEVYFGPVLEDGSCEIIGVEDGKSYGFLFPSAFTTPLSMLVDEDGNKPCVIEHSHSIIND